MTNAICEISIDGPKYWRNKEGLLHRLDGPAIEWSDGTQMWFINGQRHRFDGPAVEWWDGRKFWWVLDKWVPQEQFERHPLVIFYRLCKDAL
jgi:hypothetical protein